MLLLIVRQNGIALLAGESAYRLVSPASLYLTGGKWLSTWIVCCRPRQKAEVALVRRFQVDIPSLKTIFTKMVILIGAQGFAICSIRINVPDTIRGKVVGAVVSGLAVGRSVGCVPVVDSLNKIKVAQSGHFFLFFVPL